MSNFMCNWNREKTRNYKYVFFIGHFFIWAIVFKFFENIEKGPVIILD